MKKLNIISFFTSLLCVFCLSGCSKSEQPGTVKQPQALSIVLGAHANSMGLNLNNLVVQDTVSSAVKSNGYVSVICIDGDPDLLAANLYEIPAQYANSNKTKLEADALMKANNMLSELEVVKADDPESDVLGSLRLAVRSLADISGMEKSILVIDSGLSTTGVMDFNSNLILANPKELANMLDKRSAIPDFEGITVIWLQMGDTAAPQEPLTDAQRENLTAIWKAIIEKTGGTFICSEAPANKVNNNSDYPVVSPVILPDEIPIAYDPVAVKAAISSVDDNLFREPQFLSEEQVKFIGDSDQYINAMQAEEVIRPIAQYMESHPDIRLLLIGTTAGDETTEFSLQLSKARTETVKSTLISLGIASSRIDTLGLGPDDPWHIYGVGTGMNDPLASANRKVVLLDATSETAIELMNS
ncbi:MAG: OmpA family protein [Butyrivibrio sp.]|nr:OmpA family protein [Butyrivibrio sp.]